jgi:hypothetical protein
MTMAIENMQQYAIPLEYALPVEYLCVWMDANLKIIDLTQPGADFGTINDLADKGWRIIHQNNWQMAQRAQAIETGRPPETTMICLSTLMRYVEL